jgi:hypothetical protein
MVVRQPQEASAVTGSFLALTLLAAVLLVNWRIVLVLFFAGLIALVILGMGAIEPGDVNAVGLQAINNHSTVAPLALSDGEISPPTAR